MYSSQPAPQKTAQPTQNRLVWSQITLLTTILVAALFLRFYHIDASSLWSDEGNTWALIQRSFARIATEAAADIHPPGYYWLLKLWTSVTGVSVVGMRGFSAMTGAALVYVTYRIGRHLWAPQQIALLAACLVAVNPFQIYYSQEARMYMLLALEAAGLFWALLVYMASEREQNSPTQAIFWFLMCGAAGLWTHYSFPIILISAGAAYLVHIFAIIRRPKQVQPLQLDGTPAWEPDPSRQAPAATSRRSVVGKLVRYALFNAAILILYTAWLPTALARIFAWPQGGVTVPITDALWSVVTTFAYGPMAAPLGISTLWLWMAALAPLVGLMALRDREARAILVCWLAGPILLMFGLGLFSDAFLKFLLVASPAWALCAAASLLFTMPWPREHIRTDLRSGIANGLLGAIIGISLLMPSWFLLPAYYTDPNARDNYAGIARYISVMGDKALDLVILDAPGQQDVWNYYDPGLPILPLPEQRPPDANAVASTLGQATADRAQIFALFWAEDEADPEHIVEGWLNQHAFKGYDDWQGNVRFVVYTLPNGLSCRPLMPPPTFGAQARLEESCTDGAQQSVIRAGETALVGLRWRALEKSDRRYKVSVQLLDQRNQIIAQHDAEPAGGSHPTTEWQPGELVIDNHGLTIPFGAPPGSYQMTVVLYGSDTGERLATPTGDSYVLGPLTLARPTSPLPLDILPIGHRVDVRLGPVQLAGYNAHREGYAHAPETPIAPGDLVHFTFFWVAPDPLPATWSGNLQFTLQMGDSSLSAPLAGPDYPTAGWQPGELVRGEFAIPLATTESRPRLTVAGVDIRLDPLPIAP